MSADHVGRLHGPQMVEFIENTRDHAFKDAIQSLSGLPSQTSSFSSPRKLISLIKLGLDCTPNPQTPSDTLLSLQASQPG